MILLSAEPAITPGCHQVWSKNQKWRKENNIQANPTSEHLLLVLGFFGCLWPQFLLRDAENNSTGRTQCPDILSSFYCKWLEQSLCTGWNRKMLQRKPSRIVCLARSQAKSHTAKVPSRCWEGSHSAGAVLFISLCKLGALLTVLKKREKESNIHERQDKGPSLTAHCRACWEGWILNLHRIKNCKEQQCQYLAGSHLTTWTPASFFSLSPPPPNPPLQETVKEAQGQRRRVTHQRSHSNRQWCFISKVGEAGTSSQGS